MMQKEIKRLWFAIYSILVSALVLLIVFAVSFETRADEYACRPFTDVYADVTWEMTEMYRHAQEANRYLTKMGATQDEGLRYHYWATGKLHYERSQALIGYFGAYEQAGYYEIDGLWAWAQHTRAFENDDKFLVWLGRDWTVGADGLWHNPCGLFVLEDLSQLSIVLDGITDR